MIPYRVSAYGLPETVVSGRIGFLGGTTVRGRISAGTEFLQFFVTRKTILERRFPRLRDALTPSGVLWISWPMQTSDGETDITGDIIRGIGLAGGLVDVKICAIDETWLGLKFVRRVGDR